MKYTGFLSAINRGGVPDYIPSAAALRAWRDQPELTMAEAERVQS